MAKSAAKKPSRVKPSVAKKRSVPVLKKKPLPRKKSAPAKKAVKRPLPVKLKKPANKAPVVARKTRMPAKAKATPAKKKAGTRTATKVARKSLPKRPAKVEAKTRATVTPVRPVRVISAKKPTRPAVKAAPPVPVKPRPPIAAAKVERVEPFRPPVHQPMSTDSKPKKNQIGLTVRELEHFADLLLEKRREITGDMHSMEREALRSGSQGSLSNLPVHMADMGTDNYEQEFTLGLVEKDRVLLREINNALAKIQNGSFGVCEGTGMPIGKPRLEANPWARYSIEYARQREKTGMGVRPF